MIGEATKNIPDEIRQAHPHIEWRKMAGMRDMMIHGHFSINYRFQYFQDGCRIPSITKVFKKKVI
ncbi:DUF86 domain-containing protein [Bacillus alveayuensis]|uniref:HepT-like ribonuclease domain-containing protein n=1 Tax=Aeribacillus alveayuensis TaxID=279215 RepID=UPI000B1D904A|nr:HepT-like ribonuclease domain-containing protein [Bacillus alveayuensis]